MNYFSWHFNHILLFYFVGLFLILYAKILKYLFIALVIYVVYQFGEGVVDSHSRNQNLLTIGLNAKSKNAVGREIYLLGVHTNPEVQRRINNIRSL